MNKGRHPSAGERGQVLLIALVVIFALIIGALLLFDLHSAVRAKIKVETAQQAAALAGANWQVEGLNLIGQINLIKACTLIDDGETALPAPDTLADSAGSAALAALRRRNARVRTLTETQSRLAFLVPLVGCLAAQQTAKQNGMDNTNVTLEYYARHTLPTHDWRNLPVNGFYWHVPYSQLIDEIVRQGCPVRVNGRISELPEVWSRVFGGIQLLLSDPGLYAAIRIDDFCYWQLKKLAKNGVPASGDWWQVNYINAPFVQESEIMSLGISFAGADAPDFDQFSYADNWRPPAAWRDGGDAATVTWCTYDANWYPASFSGESYAAQQANWRRDYWLREDRRPGYLYEGPVTAVDNFMHIPRFNRTVANPSYSSTRLLEGSGDGATDRTLGFHRSAQRTLVGHEPGNDSSIYGVVAKPLGAFNDAGAAGDVPTATPLVLPIFRRAVLIPSTLPYTLSMMTNGPDDLKRFLIWLSGTESLDEPPPSGTEGYLEALRKLEDLSYLLGIYNPAFVGVDSVSPSVLFTEQYCYPASPSGAGWLQAAWLGSVRQRPYRLVDDTSRAPDANGRYPKIREYLVEENVVTTVTDPIVDADGAIRTYFGNDASGYRYYLTKNGRIQTNEDIACGPARYGSGGPGMPPGSNSGPPRL